MSIEDKKDILLIPENWSSKSIFKIIPHFYFSKPKKIPSMASARYPDSDEFGEDSV